MVPGDPDHRPAIPEDQSLSKSLRILHCPTMTRGHPHGLAVAEREIGLASWSVAFEQTPFDFPSDEVVFPRPVNPLRRELRRWPLLWRAIRNFDVVHFNCGQSLMPVWIGIGSPQAGRYPQWLRRLYGCYVRAFEQQDLRLLKWSGKGIVVTYQGEDARQGDYCREHFDIHFADEVEPGYYSRASDNRKRLRIQRFDRYADRIYSLCPDLLHVLPPHAEFLPYAHVDLRKWHPEVGVQQVGDTPVVLHAPSHRGVKGTRFVLEAVSRLKEEGVKLEFVLVENMSYADAMQAYQRADLLVDQLLCGWYGGLAVELMALGKPVVCYVREDDLRFIPDEMRKELPVIHATPGTIYEVLKQWLTVRQKNMREQGIRSRRYVEKWHNPLQIAARLRDAYVSIVWGGAEMTDTRCA
jgi:glycosyltransferase involved in cell wall biosynthesis